MSSMCPRGILVNIIVKAIAGSHLFGTNTPQSDTDYKGVFLPDAKDILLQRAKKSISTKTGSNESKNTKDDVDVEFYSLQKFMEMLAQGQTVAIELLFTPDNMIIDKSPLWDVITDHKEELVHKNVAAFVGYCKTQADKYGVKGSRMGAIKKTLTSISNTPTVNRRLKEIWEHLYKDLKDVEHIRFYEQDGLNVIDVCGRKLQETITVDYAWDVLDGIYKSYGHRAKQAETNEGIDWKALSHAYRVCVQAIEILNTGKLTLPINKNQRTYILSIKRGDVPFKLVKTSLENIIDKVSELEKTSTLRSDIDKEKWCDYFVCKHYRTEILK